jgi:protoporphyrin/coproporphyrin ferrochelatase
MNGVLLCSYGSAAGVDDVPRYLTRILGRPPRPEHLADLQRRYAAVGGSTPLHATTARQAALLQRALGEDWRVEVGMKHSAPSIADGLRALVEAGVDRGVVLPLAAQDSHVSVGGYHRAAREALAAMPGAPAFAEVRGFATQPLLLEAWAERVQTGLAAVPKPLRQEATVLFTAHSLPSRVIADGDPYPAEVRATCAGVARRAGLVRWEQAWQSAAGQDWLGPDVLVALEDLAKRGFRAVVIAPVGFVSDHLETLYDLDVEAAQRARDLGLTLVRCPALDDDPRFIALLAEVSREALA